ncbi:MAG: hypothetical protein KF878_08425 [Planctomycetes bacterium]|nr:hypothetical protein [Planctomycetota bacterium]
MSTSTLPGPIRQKLSSARVRLRTVDLALGLARAVLAASVALIVLFMLDTALEPPLGVLRAFALFVALLAAAAVTVFLTKPIRRPLSDDDVALLVEREHPALRDSLVSTVQLARQLDAPDLYTSRALIRSTIDRTARQVDGVDFGRVVRTGPLIPLWVLIAAFMGLGGLLMSNPTVAAYADTFYRRVVLGDWLAAYPKLVKLHVLLEGQDVAVAKGDDLTVDVRVLEGAHLIDKLTVRTRFGDARLEEREVRSADGLLYKKSYQNITEPFTFWFEDEKNDVVTPPFAVRVVQRPRVEGYEFFLRYPEYTGKPAEAVTQPDLQVPVGTEVTYVVVANKPLEEAALRLEYERARRARGDAEAPEAEVGPKPTFLADIKADAMADGGEWSAVGAALARLKLGAEDGRRVLVGRFHVNRDVRFYHELLAREPDGRSYNHGAKPVVFTVTALADQRPRVQIPVPGRRKQVTPQAKLPLVIEAADDYGLQSLALHHRTEREGAQRGEERIALPLTTPNPRQVKLPWQLDMADLRLQPGDLLRYVAVATDHNIDEALRTAESRAFEVQVVRPEDLERILQDRLQALKERLEAAAREETEVRTATLAFVGELGPKDVLTDDDKRRLHRLDQDQRRVTVRLEDVLNELTDIAAERALNRLDDAAAAALVEELSVAVRDLAKDRSPVISRELEDARAVARLDDRVRTRLGRVPDLQQQLIDAITALAARIGKWGDFTEVIQELRDLYRGEERIIEGTRRATQQEHR